MLKDIKEAIVEVFTSEIMVKALNTFWQAALAVMLLDLDGVIALVGQGDFTGLWTLLIAVLVGGAAAGLSAVKTYLRQLLTERK